MTTTEDARLSRRFTQSKRSPSIPTWRSTVPVLPHRAKSGVWTSAWPGPRTPAPRADVSGDVKSLRRPQPCRSPRLGWVHAQHSTWLNGKKHIYCSHIDTWTNPGDLDACEIWISLLLIYLRNSPSTWHRLPPPKLQRFSAPALFRAARVWLRLAETGASRLGS